MYRTSSALCALPGRPRRIHARPVARFVAATRHQHFDYWTIYFFAELPSMTLPKLCSGLPSGMSPAWPVQHKDCCALRSVHSYSACFCRALPAARAAKARSRIHVSCTVLGLRVASFSPAAESLCCELELREAPFATSLIFTANTQKRLQIRRRRFPTAFASVTPQARQRTVVGRWAGRALFMGLAHSVEAIVRV